MKWFKEAEDEEVLMIVDEEQNNVEIVKVY